MTLHKNAKPAFFCLFLFSKSIFKRCGAPEKLKWASKFQNLGAHLAPKIFNKVSPLLYERANLIGFLIRRIGKSD